MFLWCVPVLSCVLVGSPKKAVEETWRWGVGVKHSGELHPILFFSSLLFLYTRDVSSQLKGCVSQHHFNELTPRLWGVEIGKKHCQRAVLWCQGTPKVQHERADFFIIIFFILCMWDGTLLTTSPLFYLLLTSPEEMNNLQMGKHALFVVHSDCICFLSHCVALFLKLNKKKTKHKYHNSSIFFRHPIGIDVNPINASYLYQ